MLAMIIAGSDASASVTKLVESILFTFVARRKGRRLSEREKGRMIASFKRIVTLLMELEDDMDSHVDFVKYHLSCLMSEAAGDESRPPAPPSADKPLFSGWTRLCVKRAIARHDVAFIYSLLMSKRAWPALSKKREAKALEDHKVLICGEDRGPVPDDLLEMIQQTSKEIFGPNRAGKENLSPPTKLMPTGSACLQSPRSKGGTASLAAPMVMPTDFGVLGRTREVHNAVNNWRQMTYDHARADVETRRDDRESGILDVEVQVIAEPAKFRIITKGDGYLYTALQPCQGQLIAAWKKHPASTMTKDLDLAVQGLYDQTPNDWAFSSVDYKSATDLLKMSSTKAVLLPLTNLFDSDLAWLSLQNARVRYPDGTVFDQTGGQLMGHPLSFPFLCCINVACYRTAIMRWVRLDPTPERVEAAKVMWRNALVNGDDMLFRAPRSFMEVFINTTKEAGLVVSIGKNYVSDHIALINSQLFQLKAGRMVRLGYLNLKLLTGVSLKDGESSATPEQIGKDVGDMVALCPWTRGCIPLAFRRFSSKWKGWFQPNWYLPVHLGGYGVPVRFAQDDWRVTKGQRL
jgi:hypothetical protein